MAKKRDNQAKALPYTEVVADEDHAKLIRWVNEADDATLPTRELADKSRQYYDSEQWTDEEKRKLKDQKQAATVINRCKPKIDSLMGMERANRTTAKAFPRTPKHTQGASAATEAVRFCLQDNMYDRQRSDAWENLLIEGTGGLEIIVQPNKEEGYKIVIRHIMWDRLIYDPHSRRKDFSDARFLGQVVWMDYDEALKKYPEAKDVLATMQSGSSTYDDKPKWMDNTRRRVKIVELYYRKDSGDWWYACFTRGGYCETPKISPYKNEEGQTEHAYEFASLFVGRDGDRYGAMKQFLDIQDEINKRRSKALHLNSVRQTFGTSGAVADVNKARKELAKPDGHVEFSFGEFGKDFGVLPTGDMAAGQFNLLSEAKMEIDAVGANAATMGKDKTVQSGVALRQRALTGQTELAPMFDILKNLDIRVYRKTWNRVKSYWKSEMWLRVTDDENNLKFVGLNKPVTKLQQALQLAQEKGVPPEQLKLMEQQLSQDPSANEVVSTANDIVNLDVDIVMDDAPDTVTQEVEDFQAMAEMVKSGFPLPPKAVIMSSPLSNKDKILKMMDEQPQIPPKVQEQMQQLQESFEQCKAELQKSQQENQALKQDQSSEQAKIAAKAQSDKAAQEAKAAQQLEDQRLAREQFAFDKQLEIDKANHAIDLEERRAKALHDQNEAKWKAEQGHRMEELAFNQKCRADDEKAKVQEKAKAQEAPLLENAMPKFVDALAKITETFAAALEGQQKAMMEMAKAISKEKTVTLGGIKREDGMLTGASATIQ